MSKTNQYADSSSYKPTTGSNATLWVVAIGVALTVVMMLALLMPRLSGGGAVNWTVTILAGVVAGAIAFGVAYAKRGSGKRRAPGDDAA